MSKYPYESAPTANCQITGATMVSGKAETKKHLQVVSHERRQSLIVTKEENIDIFNVKNVTISSTTVDHSKNAEINSNVQEKFKSPTGEELIVILATVRD